MHRAHAVAFRVRGCVDTSRELVAMLRRLVPPDRVKLINLAFDRGVGPALALGAVQMEKLAPDAPTLFVPPHYDLADEAELMEWAAVAYQRVAADCDCLMFAKGLVFARPRCLAAVCAARVPWLFRLLQFAMEAPQDECARYVEEALRGLAPTVANAAAASWISGPAIGSK